MSTTKIEKLTPEQEIQLKAFQEECMKIGTCTDPADFPRAEKAIRRMYELLGKPAPEFVHMPSVFAAEKFINESQNKTGYNGTSFWGQQEMYWIARFEFAKQIGVTYDADADEKLGLWGEIARSIMWWYPFTKACILVDRPSAIHLKDPRTLHCETGPAFEFRDGTGVYVLNGVRVPKWLVETKAADITAEQVMGLSNAQQRAEAVKKVGLVRLKEKLKPEVIDKYDLKLPNGKVSAYELFTIEIEGRRCGPYLQMVNPSTGHIHIEGAGEAISGGGVNTEIKTCRQALAHKWGYDDFVEPQQLT